MEDKITFEYDDNGQIITYINGKRAGEIYTMGNDITAETEVGTDGKVDKADKT